MQNHHAAMYRRRVARSSCAVLAATGATLMQSAVSAVGRGQLTRGSSLSYHAHTHNAQAGGLLLLLHTFFPMGLATMSFAHSAAASIRPTVTPLVMGNCCRIGECGSCAPHPPPSHQAPRLGCANHSGVVITATAPIVADIHTRTTHSDLGYMVCASVMYVAPRDSVFSCRVTPLLPSPPACVSVTRWDTLLPAAKIRTTAPQSHSGTNGTVPLIVCVRAAAPHVLALALASVFLEATPSVQRNRNRGTTCPVRHTSPLRCINTAQWWPLVACYYCSCVTPQSGARRVACGNFPLATTPWATRNPPTAAHTPTATATSPPPPPIRAADKRPPSAVQLKHPFQFQQLAPSTAWR